MAEYIYFCTSLPFLHYGAGAPLDSEAFLYAASGNLSAADFARLSELDFCRAAERVARGAFGREYYSWELALRNQVLLQRLGQRNARLRSGGQGSSALAVAVGQLLQQEPLAMEQGLDQLRWAKLNELCGSHLFDMVFLATYFLKLKILERAALWQKGAGKELYETASKEIVEGVM